MRHLIASVILLLFGLTAKCQLIVDNAGLLTENEELELTNRLLDIKDKSTIETLVYITPDLDGKSSMDYGMDLSQTYPAGVKGINNGIIILLSMNDRNLQIMVGYGLEWILGDSETRLITDQMIPFFKQSGFFSGINKGIDLINEKVIEVDWKPNSLKKLTAAENGKIFKVQYSNKTGKTKYKYAIDTDPQFSKDFKIKLNIDGNEFDLYYSKYMNDMISKILTSNKITVYFRLSDFDNKRLELMGINKL